jgi:hypothetical protein
VLPLEARDAFKRAQAINTRCIENAGRLCLRLAFKAIPVAIVALGPLMGCSQQPGSVTASVAPAAAPPEVPNTPPTRLEHIAWNSAWAQNCGFYFDNQKLKSAYLTYEANAGTSPDQINKLANTYDKVQKSILAIAATHRDQCTDQRNERIRASIARYLAGDFSPGETV